MIVQHSKIEKACADHSDAREVLQYVFFDGEKLIASNGHILAVNTIVEKGEKDLSGLVPPKAMIEARRKGNYSTIHAEETYSFPNSNVVFKRTDQGMTFPDWEKAFSDKVEREHVITLNADLLKKLADAICTDKQHGIKLFVSEDRLAPVRVEPHVYNGNFGYISPMRTAEDSSPKPQE